MILLSILLMHFVNYNWMWLAVFVGVNLFQFGITKWCMLDRLLKFMGVSSSNESNGCGCN